MALQPSVPLQIAQDILDQPVQPLADPATLQQDQQQQAQDTAMTTFFRDTFSQLQQQEADRQAQQGAMQQQAAAMPDPNALDQGAVDAQQPLNFDPNAGVSPDVSAAVPSQVPLSPRGRMMAGAIDAWLADHAPQQQAAAPAEGDFQNTQHEGGGGWGAIGGALKDFGSDAVGAVRDAVDPTQLIGDIQHPVAGVERRAADLRDVLHSALGIPMTAGEQIPARALDIESYPRQVADVLHVPGSENLGPAPVPGTLGEAGRAITEKNPYAGFLYNMAVGAISFAPLDAAGAALGLSPLVLRLAFNADALGNTVPILKAWHDGDLSAKDAMKQLAITVAPQLGGEILHEGLSRRARVRAEQEIATAKTPTPREVPEQAQPGAGQGVPEQARDTSGSQVQTESAIPSETQPEVRTESAPVQITERPQTPTDVRADRHVLTTPEGGMIDYRGTHINDVNAGPVQGQGVGSALVDQAVQKIRTAHPNEVITADLNTEGGVRVMAKQPGVQFTDFQGNSITRDEAIAAAQKFEGPRAEIHPVPGEGAITNVSPGHTGVDTPSSATSETPEQAPEQAQAPAPALAGDEKLLTPEIPTPKDLPQPAEANPIADAAGITPRQPARVKGRTPAPIAGGSKVLPEVPTLPALENSMQSSRVLNRVIRRVPWVGSVARTVFGSSADTSTEPARLAAAHGALQIAYDNAIEVGLAHVAHDANIREAFGQPKISDVRTEPAKRQYSVEVTDKATGQKTTLPINDLLEANLNQYDLTPQQRDAVLLRRQVWNEAVDRYADALKYLKQQKFRISGLQEAVDSLHDEQLFPRMVLGRVDAVGTLHTNIGEDFNRDAGLSGAVKTSGSFKGARAGIDVYETPDHTRVEVPLGGRVVRDGKGWKVLTKEDLALLKEEDPEAKLPKGVQLTRVHALKTSELVAVPKGKYVYETPDGTRLNMSTEEARAYRKGLPKDQWPVRLESNPYTRAFSTAEMEARGVRYEDPDIALASKMREIGRRTADLELLGQTLARGRDVFKTREQIMGRGAKTGVYRFQPAEKFGGVQGDVIDVRPFDAGKVPALKDYYGPRELVNEMERRFGAQRTKLLPVVSELGQDARGLIASGDIGTIGIQLMGSVANDMANLSRAAFALATGHPVKAQTLLSNITGKSIMAKFHTAIEGEDFLSRTLADPKNQDLLERWGPYINPPHQSEFASAAATGHGLAKLPVVGGTFKRLNQMFENALFISQLEHARALDKIYPNAAPAEREALGSWVRNSVGTLSMRRLGVAPLQQDIESTYIAFAPRYTRSLFAAAGALMKNDLGGKEARLALGSLFAAGAAAYIGTALALGQKPEFNPQKPGFMSVRIGDNWVGIGGGIKAMSHLIANSGDTLFTHPQDFLSPDFTGPHENPILNFWRSRTSPITGTAIDLFTGTDFRGHPIHLATDWPSLLISHGIPFAGQGALEANGNAATKIGMGLITGLGYRAAPLTAYQMYDQYLKDQRNAVTGEQRFPDGALTVQTNTNGFNDFITQDPQAAHLKAALDDSRRQGTQSQRDVQAAVDDRNKKLQAAEEQFKQTHDYQVFRKQDTAIRAASADAMKALALSSVSSTADKQVLNSWFDTYKDPRAIDPVTGDTNPEGIDQAQAEWKQQHPGEYERVVVPNTTQGATPLETQLRKDRQQITDLGWWDTDNTAWQKLVQRAQANGIPMPATSSEVDYIKARTQQLIATATARGIPQPELWAQAQIGRDRVLQAFDQIRTRDRLILQRQHPELTVLLARWGYNSVSQREYAMATRALAQRGINAASIY